MMDDRGKDTHIDLSSTTHERMAKVSGLCHSAGVNPALIGPERSEEAASESTPINVKTVGLLRYSMTSPCLMPAGPTSREGSRPTARGVMSLISPNALELESQRSYYKRSASKAKSVSAEPVMKMLKRRSGIPLPHSDLLQARGATNSLLMSKKADSCRMLPTAFCLSLNRTSG